MHQWLGIVIIGRDEAANLPALFESLAPVAPLVGEVLYVDSASADGSAEVAARHGASVIQLPPSPHLCAAAGRYVGTRAATCPWLLYLDGDMTLTPAFSAWLSGWVPTTDGDVVGYTGAYLYRDARTGVAVRKVTGVASGLTPHFGGAVLLSRAAVLEAGNWSPEVVSNEEIELHSRLRAQGRRVRALDMTMIGHTTEIVSNLAMAREIFVPYQGNRKYYGVGQAVSTALRRGTLPALVRAYPLPFAFLAGDGASVAIATVLHAQPLVAAAGLTAIQLALFAGVRSVKRYVLGHALALRVLPGFVKDHLDGPALSAFRRQLDAAVPAASPPSPEDAHERV